MNPENYIFYRIDIANEHVKGVLPSKLTYRRFCELVTPHLMVRVLNGRRVRNSYGIYWMEPKEINV